MTGLSYDAIADEYYISHWDYAKNNIEACTLGVRLRNFCTPLWEKNKNRIAAITTRCESAIDARDLTNRDESDIVALWTGRLLFFLLSRLDPLFPARDLFS